MTTAAAALAAVTAMAAPAQAAEVHKIYATHNGVIKAWATWEGGGIDQLCANLVAGYSATATINGNSVTDYSDDGSKKCIWVNNTTNGNWYTAKIIWQGTGGATETGSTLVQS
ncbi:hypothetical protein ACT8ZV_12935 [Nocardioides sp. MAHUQ-72]|uniref:hypothetical protein n=1 Tax=unclassified Nocardioides TaxID=2615069 RepID=UPI0036129176